MIQRRSRQKCLRVPVREHWVQAEVFGRGCWQSSFAFACLLAMQAPVWLFYGQAGAITKPIPFRRKKKSRFWVFGRVNGILFFNRQY